jgi:beta-galactosidase
MVELRPQVPVWERIVPEGSGITGLWRSAPGPPPPGMMAFLLGGGPTVFTIVQSGGVLTGQVEDGGAGFLGGGGGVAGTPITDGKVNGENVSFRAGNASYAGMVKGDRIELTKTVDLGWLSIIFGHPAEQIGERPAIGPAPDGSDPSFDLPPMSGPPTVPLVLRRAQR